MLPLLSFQCDLHLCERKYDTESIHRSGTRGIGATCWKCSNMLCLMDSWMGQWIITKYRISIYTDGRRHVDGVVQERRNSSALAMELRLSCTNPSMLKRSVINYLTKPTSTHFCHQSQKHIIIQHEIWAWRCILHIHQLSNNAQISSFDVLSCGSVYNFPSATEATPRNQST